jgi:hypothetical protein
MKLYLALKRAKNATVNGELVTSYNWRGDDDEDANDAALNVDFNGHEIVIYSVDKIAQTADGIMVSIGAKDFLFKFK